MGADAGRGGQIDRYWHTLLGQGEPVTHGQLSTMQLLLELGDKRPRVAAGLDLRGD